jgi:hypothetical protein
MDGTITWMLVVAGATIALMGVLLFVSEKEVRKKRREIAGLVGKLSRPNAGVVAGDYQNSLTKLEDANKELQEQLSSLSRRLASTEHEFTELESERRQLENSNQKFNDEALALRQQLHSALKANEEARFDRAAFNDQLTTMASELKSTTAKLGQAKLRIEELENADDPSALANAERFVTESRAEFENNIRALQRDLADREDKLRTLDTVTRQLLDLEEKYDKALLDNRELQQEITCRREQLSNKDAAPGDFGIVHREMDDPRLRSSSSNHEAQMQFDVVGLSENRYSSRHAAQTGTVLLTPASTGLSGMDGSESHVQSTGSHTALQYVEPGLNENKLTGGDLELRQSANDRTAQLSHLLAWVRLHGGDQYRDQIDSLKDFTDLSERERGVVRDIFLARADEAQKRGRDDAMLRYRNWAKNIVYHTRFADDEIEDLPEDATPKTTASRAIIRDRTGTDMVPAITATNAAKAGLTNLQPDRVKSPAGNIALGIGVGLGLVLILLVQLFFDTPAEITVASDEALTPAKSQIAELPPPTQSIGTSQSASLPENTRDEPSRPEERIRTKPDDVKAAVRNANKEPAAKTNRAQNIFGAYTIVKSTPVYSEPNEGAALITNLDPGTQVNVVAARQGWYEIRSRSGRPPGFIRQGGASRNR